MKRSMRVFLYSLIFFVSVLLRNDSISFFYFRHKTTERQEGLGANTVISDFSETTVKDFLAKVDQYRIKAKLPIDSPCDIIIKELARFA